MKVLSIYYSATGGTKVFQKVVQKTCENYDISFTELDITDNTRGISQKWLNQFDVYLIGGPIIFRTIPTSLQQLVKKNFLTGNNKKVILYTTSVYAKSSTIYGLAQFLKNRGYRVSGVINVKSFNNFYFSDRFKPNSINSKSEVIKDYEMKARLVKELFFTSVNVYYDSRYIMIRHATFAAIGQLFSHFFLSSFSLRHFHAVHKYCINDCSMCADECPASNIVMHNNYPTFGKNCLACSKCIQSCPHNAISYNGKSIKQMNQLTIYDFTSNS